jgi:hypothetical protein
MLAVGSCCAVFGPVKVAFSGSDGSFFCMRLRLSSFVCARRQPTSLSSLHVCILTHHHLLPLSYIAYTRSALFCYRLRSLSQQCYPLTKCLSLAHHNHEQLLRRRKEACHPAGKGAGAYQRSQVERCITTVEYPKTWPSCEPVSTLGNLDHQQTTEESCTKSSSIDTRRQAEERNSTAISTPMER